jgi:hypothetical protein
VLDVVRDAGQDSHVTDPVEEPLPETLTIDEAFRAAFYMVLQYLEIEKDPSSELVFLAQYLWTDPARWNDWQRAVRRALHDDGLANPDHEGRWQDRPDWPTP